MKAHRPVKKAAKPVKEKELGALPGDIVILGSRWKVEEVRLGRSPTIRLGQGASYLVLRFETFYSKFTMAKRRGRRTWIRVDKPKEV
ncbi:MAG TPA: hypothetical protein VMX15_00125 [Candidatus Heimdallarchaeota archaeon]|nr:hypothetical protein [Candidatus Heimdallarchaeota archaeon]